MRECDLRRLIEETRSRLFKSAAKNGLDSQVTIDISQELDVLINCIQRKHYKENQSHS
ncbi:aspartyl-phosphate phosphatase Spo0E family protein [Rossellomorea vietnamensis]|uniref:Aspartyl-phosphate phosphatase Spo0E family protein n=2 Tax=Rossellomorea TaxID=2837508 RepID=A0A5D4KIF2_9BACI|nr:aspartyl-phosphate phosphatase Spo0E family protein [Rossellomorea aquimaris]TYR77031.1 aspartyl-phosphate phosphatase Spo0E family protein [Rossellomorea vietnamensis]TYS84248.1 aspartyl-phosphate phosphatase Spo0E family protein [Rossellomorea aquimaris]